jgi:hypothetical protein
MPARRWRTGSKGSNWRLKVRQKVGKAFFFVKKNQKASAERGIDAERCPSPRKIEVFLLLFVHKKKVLLIRRYAKKRLARKRAMTAVARCRSVSIGRSSARRAFAASMGGDCAAMKSVVQ